MIADLKPYPAMKDSGVEWLGEVPEHWEVRRNGRLFGQRNETGYPDLPVLEVSLRTGIRVRNFEKSKRKQVMSDRDKYKRSAKGDIAYNMMRMWQGAVGVTPTDGLISPAYVVARPYPGTDSKYYCELFRTDAYMKEVDKYSRGIVKDRNRLYWEDFKRMPSCYPPASEQTTIVRYLDHVDRRVRRYVRAKQKLIGLLEEQKQAIIHRAVTRGLNPGVPLKDSGVEWLGDVPEHWEAVLLGRGLSDIGQGWSPVAAEGELVPDQWAVLTLSAVRKGKFNPAATKPIPISAEIPDGIEVRNGDLLLTRSNTRELVGDVCIVQRVRPKTVICDLIYRLTTDSHLFNSGFLMYQLLGPIGRRQIEQDARGSSGTMPKISQRHIRSWRVLSPPLSEQAAIVGYLAEATTDIDTAVDRARREIELLREYRTRLIADVITGQLDVREAAANLPDEPEDLEQLDEADDLMDEGDSMTNDLDATPKEAKA